MERVEFELQERKIKELKRIADSLEKIANAWGKSKDNPINSN